MDKRTELLYAKLALYRLLLDKSDSHTGLEGFESELGYDLARDRQVQEHLEKVRSLTPKPIGETVGDSPTDVGGNNKGE